MIKIYDKFEKLPEPKKRNLEFDEYSRYSRQLILPEIGKNGQENIFNSTVLVVGCGGLGLVLCFNLNQNYFTSLSQVHVYVSQKVTFLCLVKNEKFPLLNFSFKKVLD